MIKTNAQSSAWPNSGVPQAHRAEWRRATIHARHGLLRVWMLTVARSVTTSQSCVAHSVERCSIDIGFR